MADTFAPTVIQPPIPAADITPLERLVLEAMFDSEPDGDRIYFFSETGPDAFFELSTQQVETALAQSSGTPSRLADDLAPRLRGLDADADLIEIDLTVTSWEPILQDIVRRSPVLEYVTAVSAFTCSKMRPDAFGGMAVFITADAIKAKSTDDILAEFIAGLEDGPPPGG